MFVLENLFLALAGRCSRHPLVKSRNFSWSFVNADFFSVFIINKNNVLCNCLAFPKTPKIMLRRGNTSNKIVQLVRQHCCRTSCMSMLLNLPPHLRTGQAAKIRNYGGKTSNIGIKLVRQQCCATSLINFICCSCNRALIHAYVL